MLAAKLIADGRIDGFDAPIPNSVPGASAAYPGDATIRMFATMTSDYGLPAPRTPGRRHAYNNHAIDFLGEYLARRHFGLGPDRMDDVLRTTLFAALGRQDPLDFKGQWGGWYGGLQASCRDLARLGLLLLRDGVWESRRLLDPEFTRGLFRSQIPADSRRYESREPDEDSMWNQQAATDRLDEGWSFGLWRVGDGERASGAWSAAALEGFRGKRVLLCPRGSLPDPRLEVLLVCLPDLPDEGPPTTAYLEAIRRAVIVPPAHPERDQRCLIAQFDDGTTGGLDPRRGDVGATAEGRLRFAAAGRALWPDVTIADGTVLLGLTGEVPAGSRIGVLLRAARPEHEAAQADGTQTFVGIERDLDGVVRGLVCFPSSGVLETLRGPALARAAEPAPRVLRIDFAADRITLRADDVAALGPQQNGPIPAPSGGGLLSIEAGGEAPVEVDWLLVRPAGGAACQIAVDARGVSTLAWLAATPQGALPLDRLAVRDDDLRLDAQDVLARWPTVVAQGPGFVLRTTVGSTRRLLPGREVVVDFEGRRDAVLLR